MKKKFLLPLIAIVAIAGVCTFSAFTPNSNQQVRTSQWYAYDGSGDPTQAENYVLSGPSSPGCSGDVEVCAIKAMDNGFDKPEITSTLVTEITAAVNNQQASANVNLRD
ncbi:hypothetical protein [Pedobacter alpinus]|uniref:Uncharacterized protein n=1 Tax=Pedobacter alpinus TaxID=1590643 RepID=A0ABW5TUG4_9SPHI